MRDTLSSPSVLFYNNDITELSKLFTTQGRPCIPPSARPNAPARPGANFGGLHAVSHQILKELPPFRYTNPQDVFGRHEI